MQAHHLRQDRLGHAGQALFVLVLFILTLLEICDLDYGNWWEESGYSEGVADCHQWRERPANVCAPQHLRRPTCCTDAMAGLGWSRW